MGKKGTFSGNPKTEWLVDENGADRNMRLLEDFSFTDPDGRVWLAPAGATVDGASIPRPLWVIVGSPYTDDYRRASVVHDIACGSPDVDRKQADVMFYYACLSGGCTLDQAALLYLGVRIGAWIGAVLPADAMSSERLLFREAPYAPSANERFVQDKFQEIALDMKSLPANATIADIDAVIQKHLQL